MTRPVYLALGSNLGDREENIRRAVALLDEFFGRPYTKISSLYENPAEGFDGPAFVNGAVRYDLDHSPLEILRICKKVERQAGRTREGIELDSEGARVYHSRVIDIDLLLCGDEKVDTPELKVPHPRMKEREFVMRPLAEIFDGNLLNL
jgi:2-amino-4-hydroxy-6-hydroxymethyldihydropteridine diphosphokinase